MDWLAYTLVIVFGGMFVGVFTHFLRGGTLSYYEPDKKMAGFELILALGILGFGLIGLINSI